MTTFDMSDAVYAQAPNDWRQAKKLAEEVYSGSDNYGYGGVSQAQIQLMHSVTSDCGLPGIHLFDSDKQHDGIISGAVRIGGDLLGGAASELVHHPDRLLTNLAIGAAVGAAAIVAAPEVLAVGAVAGVAALGVGMATGHNPFEAVGDFVNDCGVVANPDGHTDYEIDRAHNTVQQGGGVMLEIGAGALGGNIGSAAMTAARASGMAAIETSVASTALPAPAQRLLLTGPESGAANVVDEVQPGVLTRASNVEQSAVVPAAETFDGEVGTSAMPGFNPENRLAGDALLERLNTEAAQVDYQWGGKQFAIRNLEDPQEIRNWVRAMESTDRFRGNPSNLRNYLIDRISYKRSIPQGTFSTWQDEISRLGADAEATGTTGMPRYFEAEDWSERLARLAQPARSGEDLIAEMEAKSANRSGTTWRDYGVATLTDAAEINNFVRTAATRYPGRHSELAGDLESLGARRAGFGFHPGTTETWKVLIAQLRAGMI